MFQFRDEKVLDSQILELAEISIWGFSLPDRIITFRGKGFLKIFFGIQNEKNVAFDLDEYIENFVYRNFRKTLKSELLKTEVDSDDFIATIRVKCYGTKATFPHWIELFGKRYDNSRIVGGIKVGSFAFEAEACGDCKNTNECNNRILRQNTW